ncbi:bifunctional adenosylcobinamide kinase/adenosylcobinamide-phosphate guanylyltransferase [Caloramator sp. E03]|uniref:bifunctional adenosylcobinamide kinase/adenosylcobinamide-phosphate guanylyltransferase n=1 Tax=Caloramator sp. E03 TaxID=2576307 RepID=UPI001110226F|nr:bifunctional adenosylcobinamide kinase/adenosylcobinamide-phosphate guanylyltransferase [Caloramator sp. E03]QCX32652.1 bifunctional adenosylcobinamide kinase/adenosylcobinamide-phosphate guanylyltransferase [Caloramator sp. E03]
MSRIILVTGGARSGKSSFAESIYKNEKDVVYIATSRITDDEMRDRINIHRINRPLIWRTFEGTYNLFEAVKESKNYLIDCITILASNIMFDMSKDEEKISIELQREIEDKVFNEINMVIEKVKELDGNLIMVTNEVGDSIVPENHVARVYRDIIGRVNQRVAAVCNEVYIVTCGIPLRLK